MTLNGTTVHSAKIRQNKYTHARETAGEDDTIRRYTWDLASDCANGDSAALALYYEIVDMMFAQEENTTPEDSADNTDLPF